MNNTVKKKLFNELADWIVNEFPNNYLFGEFKTWIYKKVSKYVISKNDEKETLTLLTYSPMRQQINNILFANNFTKYLLSK